MREISFTLSWAVKVYNALFIHHHHHHHHHHHDHCQVQWNQQQQHQDKTIKLNKNLLNTLSLSFAASSFNSQHSPH